MFSTSVIIFGKKKINNVKPNPHIAIGDQETPANTERSVIHKKLAIKMKPPKAHNMINFEFPNIPAFFFVSCSTLATGISPGVSCDLSGTICCPPFCFFLCLRIVIYIIIYNIFSKTHSKLTCSTVSPFNG